MARKRMIDPSIWQDEGMAELTPRQQLLYVGMFSNADDDGRLKGSESALRLTLPTLYAGMSLDTIAGDVNAVLTAFSQIVRYECNGRVYLAFRNYRVWQKIDKPSPSNLPAPPDGPEDSPTPSRMVDDISTNAPVAVVPSRTEEKLTEQNRVEARSAPAPPRAPARDRRKLAVLERTPEEETVLAILARVPGFPPDVGDETTEHLREIATDYEGTDLLDVAKSLRTKGTAVKNGWLTYRNWVKNQQRDDQERANETSRRGSQGRHHRTSGAPDRLQVGAAGSHGAGGTDSWASPPLRTGRGD